MGTLLINEEFPHSQVGRGRAADRRSGLRYFESSEFDQPVGNIDNAQFGYSVRTVSTATSIFGAFLGADASPRTLQIRAQLSF